MDPKSLSLADLEAFDPHAPDRGRNRRFCCPFCGVGKSKTAANRDLSANVETGAWECHSGGCGLTGKLREFWEDRPPENKRQRQARALRQAFGPGERPAAAPVSAGDAWREQLRGIRPLTGSPGEAYLVGRGIPLSLAVACGVKFHPSVYGRPGVVFPARDRNGNAIGGQARFIDGRERTDPEALKALSLKEGGPGVFATPGAWEAGRDAGTPIIVVEAPIDALSLAVCGYPALAQFGSHLREWLPDALSFVAVLIGTDNDAPDKKGECAGDVAAEKWRRELRRCGARDLRRLRPVGHKDWNAWLLADPDGLRAFLLREVGPPLGELSGQKKDPAKPLQEPHAAEDRQGPGREQPAPLPGVRGELFDYAGLKGYPGIYRGPRYFGAGPERWRLVLERAPEPFLPVVYEALAAYESPWERESQRILRAAMEQAAGLRCEATEAVLQAEEALNRAWASRDPLVLEVAAAEFIAACRSNQSQGNTGGALFDVAGPDTGPQGLQAT